MIVVNKIQKKRSTNKEEVLEIIRNVAEPIKFNILLEQVRAKTGTRVSPNTLSKHLKTLVFLRHVERIECVGRGNPVYYKYVLQNNNYPVAIDNCIENIRKKSISLSYASKDPQELFFVIRSVIDALYAYSHDEKRHHAEQQFESYIESELKPVLHVIKELYRPPMYLDKSMRDHIVISYANALCNKDIVDRLANMIKLPASDEDLYKDFPFIKVKDAMNRGELSFRHNSR
jgi:Fe2+ or Zn2+ uptake regulation protein